MAITQTTNKFLDVIGIDDLGWGPPTNTNVTDLDQILGSPIAIAASGGTHVLTASQLQYMALRFTGALGSNAIYQIPTGVSGVFVVRNNTTGAFTLTIAHQGGGSSVSVPQGAQQALYCSVSAGMGGVSITNTPLSASSSDTQILFNDADNIVGSSSLTYSDVDGLTSKISTATSSASVPTLSLYRATSVTPTVGIGTRVDFYSETASGVTTLGMALRSVSTAIGAAAESFDFSVMLRSLGSIVTRFLVTSAGDVQATTVSGTWVASNAEATAGTINNKIMTPLRTDQAIDAKILAKVSPSFSIAHSTLVTWTHGLGKAPSSVIIRMICTSADAGYSAGDIVYPSTNSTSDTSSGSGDRLNTIYVSNGNTTSVSLRFTDAIPCFQVGQKTTGVNTGIDNTKWDIQFVAMAFG